MKARVRGCWAAALLLSVLGFHSAEGQSNDTELVTLPGTGYEIILDAMVSDEPVPPSSALIEAIGAWLSFTFELPRASQPPNFRFIAPEAMLALRHRGVASDHLAVSGETDILALYDDDSRTIYLRDDWRGNSAAGLSIVVHEIIHHLQNMAGTRFPCDEAREKQAFAAQEQWLALFGKNLATEFGLDPFTLLVRTSCPL